MDPDILFVSTLPRPAATHRIFNLGLPVALLAPLLAPLRRSSSLARISHRRPPGRRDPNDAFTRD